MSFFGASYKPSLGLWYFQRHKMALGAGFFGCLAWWSKGLGRDLQLLRRLRRTCLPASPSPMFGQKLVCGQAKSGTLAEFGMGGKKKKKKGVLLCSLRGGLCLPGQVRGCHRSLCFRGSEWGLGAEMSVVLYSQTGTWPLAGRVTAG